jgi:hypothetical protein
MAAGDRMKYGPGQMSDRLAFLYHHPTQPVRLATILAAFAIAYALFGNQPALRARFRARFRDSAMYRVRLLLWSAISLSACVFYIFDFALTQTVRVPGS